MTSLDKIIHQPVRLKIMSVLMELPLGDQIEVVYLRKMLNLTDGNLGAHLEKLEKENYIQIEKTFVDKKPRTYINLTKRGSQAFSNHVEALESILKIGRMT